MDETRQSAQPGRHATSDPIRLVLADDHVSVRDGLQSYFRYATAGIEIVGAASDMAEAIAVCQRTQPDVLLLDLHMPGEMQPSAGIPALRRAAPTMRIIVLTAHKKPTHVESMLRLGVEGYCDKIEPAYVVEQAVRDVARGGVWYSPGVRSIIAEILRSDAPAKHLTDTQRYLIWCVAANWSYARIANQLSFSEQYVREQISRVYALLDARLNAHDKGALVAWARDHGLGPDDSPPPLPA